MGTEQVKHDLRASASGDIDRNLRKNVKVECVTGEYCRKRSHSEPVKSGVGVLVSHEGPRVGLQALEAK